tara:strand:+ start:1334 stop:2752 length:1419 start_codon:yes stop_codon:yes gene_type:complete
MAASKIHLANTDKNYKLKKTDKLTTEGKPIYVNSLTGEEHSEISVTIEYPANSGKWINVPSLKDGRVYNPKGVLAMLKAGKLTPTSTHMSEQEAIEAAVYRSTTLQSNTGETLKPSNDINLLTSQSARITEQELPGLIAEVNRAENAFQNQETGFPAQIQAADDYDPQKEAFVNQNMNTFASTFPTRDENSDGLFVADNVVNLEESLNDQILNTDQASIKAAAANGYNLKELASIMDRANAEKEDDYYDVSRRFTNRWGDNALNYSDRSGLKPRQNDPAFSQMTISPEDQAMFDKAKSIRFPGNEDANFDSNTVYDMGVSDDGIFPGFPKYNTGPLRRSSKGISSKDNESFDIPILGNDVVTNSNKQSTTNKTSKSIGSYYDDMPPAEKMKDNRSLKGLAPDYGEMPGFKKAKDGNYWSADENSEFWKTDAGYEKAVQTWGASGNPLPTYVKKPARKELDVQAIKNFFKPNR